MIKCEICNVIFKYLEKHHIISKSKGGDNKKRNIAYVCPNCHENIHRGEIILEGRFDSTSGSILIWRNKNEKSITNFNDPDVYLISK